MNVTGGSINQDERDSLIKLLGVLAKIVVFAISIGTLVWSASQISSSVNELKTQTIKLESNQAAMSGIIQALQINQATINEQISSLRQSVRK